MNAMNPPASAEMDAAWDDVVADDDSWVAIVTGSGEKAFGQQRYGHHLRTMRG